jgi:hypothetical protein
MTFNGKLLSAEIAVLKFYLCSGCWIIISDVYMVYSDHKDNTIHR